MPFVSIEPNGRLFYEIRSPKGDQLDPSKQTVLLIHTRPFHHEFMAPQYNSKSLNARYNLIAIDLPYHGWSEVPIDDKPYDYKEVAQNLWRALDGLAITQCHIFGTAIGALNAVQMAVMHPARVKSLTVCGMPPPIEPPENVQQYYLTLELASHADEEGVDQMPADMVAAGKTIFFNNSKTWTEEVHERWLATHTARPSNKPLLAKIYSATMLRIPLSQEEWSKITMPVLLIHGTKDVLYPTEVVQQNYNCMSGADRELHIIEGGAHLLSWTEAEKVNDLFLAFLERQS